MTKRIYEDDVYKLEHKATVVSISDDFEVILDGTIFFPVGGGQSSDKGTIDGIKVINVIERDNEVIHILESAPTNTVVKLKIDWNFRLDQMQQHCGEHILSGIIKSYLDGNNKGFHLGKDYVTIDVDLKNISIEEINHIEELANDAIYKNIKIKVSNFNSMDEAKKSPVRKNITVDSDIRVVEIPGVDCVACCGTHPERTGDVGIIKIFKTEKNKGMTRIFFKCGKRALTDLKIKTELINELNKKYSSDDTTLLNRINIEKEKSEKIKLEYIILKRKQLDIIVENKLIDTSKFVVFKFSELLSNDMNYIVKKVIENKDIIVLLYSEIDKKVMLTHSGNLDLDCGMIFREIKKYNGRGGGNKKVAQGSFETKEDGFNFTSFIIERVKN